MKTDRYTKVVLTGIAILLGVIAFDYKPTINAHAGIMGGSEMISSTSTNTDTFLWHLRNGKLRVCKNVRKPGSPMAYNEFFNNLVRCSGFEN